MPKKRSFKGEYLIPQASLKKKIHKVRALLFDWDGVFNNGQKNAEGGSLFSEIDSMGTNLLRYSIFLAKKEIPFTGIISGEKNPTAFHFSTRECFHSCYFKVANKKIAFEHFCEQFHLHPEEVAYVFDDVLDLPIAEKCGVRFLVDQKADVNFINYCIKNKMADYITSSPGGSNAVREACELMIVMKGNFDEVINTRKDYTEIYSDYIAKRKSTTTRFFTLNGSEIAESKPF